MFGRGNDAGRRAAIRRLTVSEDWDYMLQMLLVPLTEYRLGFHKLKGEKLVQAQHEVAHIEKLLVEIENAGGRITYDPTDHRDRPKAENVTADRHFGMPHEFSKERERANG